MALISNILINNINEILQERGLTQTWLAKEIGKKQPQLSRYLGGKVDLPDDWAEAIAKALQVPLSYLLSVKVESPREAARLRAIGLLLACDDDMVETILSLFERSKGSAIPADKRKPTAG